MDFFFDYSVSKKHILNLLFIYFSSSVPGSGQ